MKEHAVNEHAVREYALNQYAIFAEGLGRSFNEVRAVDSVDLRCSGDGVPVGLGNQPSRFGIDGSSRRLAAAVPLRHRVRTLDGLPHATSKPDQGVLRRGILQRGISIPWHQTDRRSDHQRRSDHGRCVWHLRPRARNRHPTDGTGTWCCGVDRCDCHTDSAAPSFNETARGSELVPALVARLAPQRQFFGVGPASRSHWRGQSKSRHVR